MRIISPAVEANPFSAKEITEIRTALEEDQVIVYPTDTLYGLGADVTSTKAVDTLYSLKSRDNSPISVLLSSNHQLLEMATDLSNKAIELIKAFLPGALTVICRTDYEFAPQLISQMGTVGFRVPGDSISRELPEMFGKPITTTSVNPAGMKPASSRSEVEAYYANQIDLMIDIGPINPSRGSTVIDVSSSPFKILREGEISRQALQEFLN
ncbi:MAG: threonylcarbamoyl-AMP synthase [Candidatus Marinimicrobia bacterium]|jgi:L-threonylcarbamoyladenylate synthase|nr:threonylcarbamoyl-AMP synthase [Candidatus Neomarinimicrobiota bacterium]MBT3575037.1 threonylcarbamoyl-AMP synthase [Candidatus Neomarinimicrobiota bacterium]MBT3678809.1 threonylcarbamoyl-AMP synthase [Candidatus Neomarinimicrobiota bacterium]MBT3949923.1 threonylcarbamoyl-AMP synthase [Candidatus Neomarinimicrobiota bacterium]MBT4252626.1 threonylcarbamoyl-AMP synthase [Candidatus Neomarinimicrobiota bacterium]